MRASAICLSLAALILAGCQTDGIGLSSNASAPKPKTVIVTDFVMSPDITVIDRGYTVRLSRKEGSDLPFHLRKERTLARVNDEIVATIVASLRESGLEAQPGAEDAVTLDHSALVVSGSLRAGEPVTARNKNSFGFGAGRGHVVAAVNASLFSSGSKRQLLTFDVEPAAAIREPAVPPKVAAARNAEIAGIVASTGSPNERLSPDVEVAARRLGRAIADRVLAYAKDQGWLAPPGQGMVETAPKGNAANPPEDAPGAGSERPGA